MKIQYYKELLKEYETLKDNRVYKHFQDEVNSIEKNFLLLNPGSYKDMLRVNTQSALYNTIQGISKEIPNINLFSLIKKLTDHSDDVKSITFSPDGSLFTSGSRDETVCIYNIATVTEKIEEYLKILKQEQERKRLAKIEAEKERQKRLQQQKWRDEGKCEICGTKLGFFKRLSGNTRCDNCL